MKRLGGIIVAALALAAAAPARAGDPTSVIALPEAREPPPPPAPDAPAVLEDILVTATKRRAFLRELPESISALDGAALEALGASELRDFLARIPGVGQTEIQPDLSRIAIRGIQSDVSNVTPHATGVFIDDVPLGDPFLLHVTPDLPPFDLDGIEVLKGPQGTLFGGSALAGAIRYKLADAVPGAWISRAFVQFQSLADGSPNRAAGAAQNLSLGDSAALRLVAIRRLTGGTIDDARSGEQDTDRTANFSGRALLRWKPGERWSVGLKGYRQSSHADDVPMAETTDGQFTRSRALGKSPSHTKFDFLALDATRRFDFADLTSVTSISRKAGELANAYAERTLGVEMTGQPVGSPTTERTRGIVEELRLVSSDDASPWTWLGGAFGNYYTSFTTQRIFTTVQPGQALPLPFPVPLPVTLPGQEVDLLDLAADVSAREAALFGEVSRRLGERWNVTLGLRGYRIETYGTVVSSGPIILATGSAENRNDANVRASGVNPKAAVQFQAGEHVGTYVSVSRGFRFGGIQLIGPSPISPNAKNTYRPDSLWNYELGARTQWLGRTLHADGAVFYIDWSHPAVQTTTGGAVPLNTIDNVGHARSWGGEVALRWLPPVEGVELDLSAAVTDARITEPYTAPSGATVRPGARLPGSANRQLAASAQYERPFGAGTLSGALDYVLQGDGVSDILQSMKILDYQTFDARAGWRSMLWWGEPELSFGVYNLTDERAVTTAIVASANNYTTFYNRPRTVEVRVAVRF